MRKKKPEEFAADIPHYLTMVHPDHKPAFKFVFELGKNMLNAEQAEQLALITALAMNESVRRVAQRVDTH